MQHVCAIHPETINNVKNNLSDSQTLDRLSAFLKVLADRTRLEIVNALLVSEMCVCDIAHILNMEHSAISHQLAVLRRADIVTAKKVGKVCYYALSDEHIGIIFDIAKAHIMEK